jgi:hypothetical protein|tara:strand:- start:16220 stop:16687 length:468 start_codon:yes stop_codon:yes gene_type:complete
VNEPAKNILPVLDISFVPPETLDVVWEEVKLTLKRAVKRSSGKMNVNDIYNNLIDERSHLWIVFNTDDLKISGCCITQFQEYPTGLRMLNIDLLAGKKMDNWAELGLDILYKWAKDNKCDGIEIISRPGFWHWVKHRENWKKTNVVYEVKFNENN